MFGALRYVARTTARTVAVCIQLCHASHRELFQHTVQSSARIAASVRAGLPEALRPLISLVCLHPTTHLRLMVCCDLGLCVSDPRAVVPSLQ